MGIHVKDAATYFPEDFPADKLEGVVLTVEMAQVGEQWLREADRGAVAVGPESSEWLGQLTLAVRAKTPVEVLLDTIQPYPTFSEAILFALIELVGALA